MKLYPSSSISYDQIQLLVSQIYDAALDPEKWEGTLKKIADLVKAEQSYMRIIDTRTNDVQHAYCHNKDSEWVNSYKDHYVHLDPWLNTILSTKNTFIACTHHYLANREYEKMEFYRDFVEPQGTHYGLGGKIHIRENITNYLAFNRQKKKHGFEYEHLKTMQLLVPHIQKSILLNDKTRHIELKQNLLSNALNQINSPILLVNKNGSILFINSLAEQIIEQQFGIDIKNNHITFLSQAINTKLKKLIYQATNKNGPAQQGGVMSYTHPDTQSCLSIQVTPVNPDMANIDTQSNNNALLVLSKHKQKQPFSAELLSSLYKLTPAETRLTIELCQGLTLNEIAENFSLSKNTLRSQLRSCFNKTGVTRQADLILLINSLSADIIKI